MYSRLLLPAATENNTDESGERWKTKAENSKMQKWSLMLKKKKEATLLTLNI